MRMGRKSYSQKCAAYAAIIKANPYISANEIGRRYAGTDLAMRKQDRNDFVKGYKDQRSSADYFKASIKNSDMTVKTQLKLSRMADKTAYYHAKNNTRKGKAANTKNIIFPTVEALENKTFNRVPKHGPNTYVEFYG